jgi:hypothetical protein
MSIILWLLGVICYFFYADCMSISSKAIWIFFFSLHQKKIIIPSVLSIYFLLANHHKCERSFDDTHSIMCQKFFQFLILGKKNHCWTCFSKEFLALSAQFCLKVDPVEDKKKHSIAVIIKIKIFLSMYYYFLFTK